MKHDRVYPHYTISRDRLSQAAKFAKKVWMAKYNYPQLRVKGFANN